MSLLNDGATHSGTETEREIHAKAVTFDSDDCESSDGDSDAHPQQHRIGFNQDYPNPIRRYSHHCIEDELANLDIAHTGERDSEDAPSDRFNLAFMLMILLGASTGFGWNFFITAGDYFRYAFRNTTNPDKSTMYQDMFENSLALVSCGCGLVGIVGNTFLTRIVSFKYRIYGGLLVTVAVFVFTISLTFINTDSWQNGFFLATMLSVVLISIAGNVASGGFFGIQACLPSKFATALMIGQTVSGLIATFASILSIISMKEVENDDQALKGQAAAYFGAAIAATVLSILAFWAFLRLPIVFYYLALSESVQVAEAKKHEVIPEIADISKEHFPIRFVLSRTWKHAAAITLTFVVTLTVFPGLSGNVISMNARSGSAVTNRLFLPLSCFLVFNAGDLAGRVSHGFIQFPKPNQGLLTVALVILRTALIPLFILCNVRPRDKLPVIFGDGVFVFLIAFTAFTNGYFGNLGIMYGPKLVPSRYAETTGSLMGVCLNIGLFLGALLSFGLSYFIKLY